MQSIQEEIMTTLYRVWRKRWWAITIAWIVCLIGWAFVATVPNSYRSSARILVDTSSLLQSEMGLGGALGRELNIVRQTLTSRLNLEKVLRRTELDLGLEDEAEIDLAIDTLAENIQVSSESGNLFTIAYVSTNPALSDAENANVARSVVENLLQIFMEENVTADRDDINEAIRFFEDQLADRERELEAAERRRAEFEEKYLGRLRGQESFSGGLRAARNEFDQVELELAQARRSLGILQGQIGSTPSSLGSSGSPMVTTSAARARANAMEQQISELYATGRLDSHPDVILAKRQLQRLEEQARQEEAELRSQGGGGGLVASNPVYVDLRSKVFDRQSQVAALAARRDRLQADIQRLEKNLRDSPGIAAEQARLNRDYGVLQSQYQQLLQSREEIRLQSDVQTQTQQVRSALSIRPRSRASRSRRIGRCF